MAQYSVHELSSKKRLMGLLHDPASWKIRQEKTLIESLKPNVCLISISQTRVSLNRIMKLTYRKVEQRVPRVLAKAVIFIAGWGSIYTRSSSKFPWESNESDWMPRSGMNTMNGIECCGVVGSCNWSSHRLPVETTSVERPKHVLGKSEIYGEQARKNETKSKRPSCNY